MTERDKVEIELKTVSGGESRANAEMSLEDPFVPSFRDFDIEAVDR